MEKNKIVKINKQQVAKNILFLFIFLLVITTITSTVTAKKEQVVKDITIEKADTLWSIARNITKTNKQMNIQSVIYDIKEINQMENSDIYEGQVLQVPVY